MRLAFELAIAALIALLVTLTIVASVEAALRYFEPPAAPLLVDAAFDPRAADYPVCVMVHPGPLGRPDPAKPYARKKDDA
jgi:hypothetical protein